MSRFLCVPIINVLEQNKKNIIFYLKINIFYSREILLYLAWTCLRNVCADYMYIAEWLPFGKELRPQLTICSLCIMPICCLNYFPFWFNGQDIGSDCVSSWSMLIFLLSGIIIQQNKIRGVKLFY